MAQLVKHLPHKRLSLRLSPSTHTKSQVWPCSPVTPVRGKAGINRRVRGARGVVGLAQGSVGGQTPRWRTVLEDTQAQASHTRCLCASHTCSYTHEYVCPYKGKEQLRAGFPVAIDIHFDSKWTVRILQVLTVPFTSSGLERWGEGAKLPIVDEVRKQEFLNYNFMEVFSPYLQGMERSLGHQFQDGIALGKGGQR